MSEDKAKEMISDVIADAVIKAFKKVELDRGFERIRMKAAALLDEIEELEEKVADIKGSLEALDHEASDLLYRRLQYELEDFRRHAPYEDAKARAEKLIALKMFMAMDALQKLPVIFPTKLTPKEKARRVLEVTKALAEVEKRWKEILMEEPEEVRAEVKRILAQLQAITFK